MTSSAADPVARVQWELRDRARRVGDVVLVGDGEWLHKDHVTSEQLAEISAISTGKRGATASCIARRLKPEWQIFAHAACPSVRKRK